MPERRFASQARGSRRANTHPRLARRSSDGKTVIVGYAAVYYVSGDPGTEYVLSPGLVERIRPGAFEKAVRSDDVRALFNHSPDHVLGRLKSGTLRLTSDSVGLRYAIDPPNTQMGRDICEMIGRGDVSGSSFAFDVAAEHYVDDANAGVTVRELTELQLFDVGPVTYPAYEASHGHVEGGDPARSSSKARELASINAVLTREAGRHERSAVLADIGRVLARNTPARPSRQSVRRAREQTARDLELLGVDF